MAQDWNFAGIEGSAGDLAGAVNTTHGLLDEGKASLDDPVSKYIPQMGQLWVTASKTDDAWVLRRR